MPNERAIRLAYSPDSDDAFMFWALSNGKVDQKGLSFTHMRAGTEVLNRSAATKDAPDVVAISIHQYAYLSDDFLLLPHGGSVGAGYGPMVVARRAMLPSELQGKRIAIPGLRTTAYLVLRLLVGDFEPVEIPIEPYRAVFDALDAGVVDAALLIHEGRLTYEREGVARVLEIGEAWTAKTQLPLPLGGNVIRRSLGDETVAKVSRVLGDSIRWALAHRGQVIEALMEAESRQDVKLDHAMLDRYLGMYANEDTLDYGPRGRTAIEELFRRGHEAGFLPHRVRVEFAPF